MMKSKTTADFAQDYHKKASKLREGFVAKLKKHIMGHQATIAVCDESIKELEIERNSSQSEVGLAEEAMKAIGVEQEEGKKEE